MQKSRPIQGEVMSHILGGYIGLFCKRALSKRRYSAKETCNFKEPTNRSRPIGRCDATYGVATISRLLKIAGLFCTI